ncbi:FAD-dependent oxidoreductase [Allomuricauda sp. d1]|uniref:NAD(P)/FAD-dependent oxidoreductase n=1 Tax=Allomuricauda sp. d1 TaxID=3136725 RepID=UPI0031D22642
MQLSYWEYKTWFSNIDHTVVGSGIVGLSTAIFLKEKYPKAKVVVLERGVLPQGASTKNAGFACFGSLSEICSDLKAHSEKEVIGLIWQRHKGIQLLRNLLGDDRIGYQRLGGHEIFLSKNENLFEECLQRMAEVNEWLRPVFGEPPFALTKNRFGFKEINPQYITHQFEGQLDAGMMMKSLLDLAVKKGVHIFNSVEVLEYDDTGDDVSLKTDAFEFSTRKLIIATNGFAKQFLKEEVNPARAQVLVTKPIRYLHIKGAFHFDEGYYYFRNIDGRILFGGGRNLDFKVETTTKLNTTEKVQNRLEALLSTVILPNTPFEIEHRWSGIMGVGNQKKPIVKALSDNVFCGIRLGGMGVAIGSTVGKELASSI